VIYFAKELNNSGIFAPVECNAWAAKSLSSKIGTFVNSVLNSTSNFTKSKVKNLKNVNLVSKKKFMEVKLYQLSKVYSTMI
jgi:hypothetical protein